jgi:uncharacterized protein YkwD
VLRRTRVALAMAVVVIVAGVSVSAVPGATAHRVRPRNVVTAMPSLGVQVAARIDAARAQQGLGPLRLSPRLTSAASSHSLQMAVGGFFSHESADGSSPWKRLARFYPAAGYGRWQVGETIGWYSPGVDAAGAVHDWLTSPEHRAILLAPGFREIGVSALHATAASGYFKGQEVTLITADFGVRAH